MITHENRIDSLDRRRGAMPRRSPALLHAEPAKTVVSDVLLIDRSRLFREGLKVLLGGSPYMVTRETAGIADAMPALAQGPAPTFILLAVEMLDDAIDPDFLPRLEDLRRLAPSSRLILLSDDLCLPQLVQFLALRIDGYLLKDITLNALKQSLALVLAGEKVLPTKLVGLLIADIQQRPRAPAGTRPNCPTGNATSWPA